MATDLASARRTQQRRAARQAQAREDAKHAARVAVWTQRLMRRAPCALDPSVAAYAAERMVSARFECDRLASRARPTLYPGWRADTAGRMAYLLGPNAGAGLPLAHEGGEPMRCADPLTADLSHANYRARRAAARAA